jgi:hypothetical protein
MATLEAQQVEREASVSLAKRMIESYPDAPLPDLVGAEYPPEGCDGLFYGAPCRIPAGATRIGQIELLHLEQCYCEECFLRNRRGHGFAPLLTLNPPLAP